MKNIFICILSIFVSYAYAKDTNIAIQEIPVTANPLQLNSNDMVRPVRIIGSKEGQLFAEWMVIESRF